MKKIISILIAILLVAPAFGQIIPEFANKRYIEVTGTSETEIVPDEIFITITLLERMENKEKITIEKQEADLKQSVKELGIDMANLSLSSADADYRKIKMMKKDVMIAKSYILKVNNAEMIGKVYEKLDKINVNDAFISKYSHSKILELQKENRLKAIKAAKEKVDYLLSAISQTAGQPIQIMETDNYVQNTPRPGSYYTKNAMQAYSFESPMDGEELSFKKITVRSSFMVKYEILNK
jgi:uncharacterized protein